MAPLPDVVLHLYSFFRSTGASVVGAAEMPTHIAEAEIPVPMDHDHGFVPMSNLDHYGFGYDQSFEDPTAESLDPPLDTEDDPETLHNISLSLFHEDYDYSLPTMNKDFDSEESKVRSKTATHKSSSNEDNDSAEEAHEVSSPISTASDEDCDHPDSREPVSPSGTNMNLHDSASSDCGQVEPNVNSALTDDTSDCDQDGPKEPEAPGAYTCQHQMQSITCHSIWS